MLVGSGGRRNGMSKRRTPQKKANIVTEFFITRISAAELCRRHNVSPATFQDWKDRFLQGSRQALAGGEQGQKPRKGGGEPQEDIVEITVANDILKNHGGGKAMERMGLNRALALRHVKASMVPHWEAEGHPGRPADRSHGEVSGLMAAQITRETRTTQTSGGYGGPGPRVQEIHAGA